MKHLLISLFWALACSGLIAQDLTHRTAKLPIDSSVYNKWPAVEEGTISNDGRYVSYMIKNQPAGSHTLVLQAIKGNWKMEMQGINGVAFTPNSHMAVFTKPNDSLCMVTLGSSAITYIAQAASFKLPQKGNAEWLVYQPKSPENKLVVRNLKTGKESEYSSVSNHWWSEDGQVLVVQTASNRDSVPTQSLKYVKLNDGNMSTIWEGAMVINLVFDKSNQQLAFLTMAQANNAPETSIWHYKAGTDKAVLLTNNQSARLDSSLKIESLSGFSDNGNSIFLTLKKETPVLSPQPDPVPVNVWSYTDTKLQSQQLSEINDAVKFSYMLSVSRANRYEAVLHIQDRRIIRLEQEHDYLAEKRGDMGFIHHWAGNADPGERHWNAAAQVSVYVVSLKDGQRKQLKVLGNREIGGNNISPAGKYLVYYDEKQKSFFSYEMASDVIHNITPGVTTSWLDCYGNVSAGSARGVAGWLKDDKAVLIYDRYDIWKVDPAGEKPPINLTNGYGRRNNIIFYLGLQDEASQPIAENAQLILNAFDLDNKDNGFCRKRLNKTGDPELLTMGPYLYEVLQNPYVPPGSSFSPIKAQNAAVYLVRRMSAASAPNYFVTTDFKIFIPLSHLHPEKDYNWYSAELHTWKTPDGNTTQGIFYKPENFDPNKKYPVIFNYYERKSDGLNAYIQPEALSGSCNINIPTYISNGYLVFSPDIYYTIGDPMQGTYNAMVSAAEYISKLPFVDAKKMGLQGCSFGGIQTNYLVTHTNLFTAACSAAGTFDLISQYGGLFGIGSSLQSFFETGQMRMGATLWEIPDKYIKNSPIFQADKVTTPLLMMHTTNDGICPFANAVEFFTALRRLGKKVWMLEYTDGDHGVWGKSAVDFNIRMAQFFDHYLKDAPPPKWMTKGIPAKLKGIEDGLTLDNSTKTPGPGLLATDKKDEGDTSKPAVNIKPDRAKSSE